MARIRALLRRKERKKEDNNVLLIADLEIDTDKYKVKRADQEVELTKKEFDLLVYLVENQGLSFPGRIFSVISGVMIIWVRPILLMSISAI